MKKTKVEKSEKFKKEKIDNIKAERDALKSVVNHYGNAYDFARDMCALGLFLSQAEARRFHQLTTGVI